MTSPAKSHRFSSAASSGNLPLVRISSLDPQVDLNNPDFEHGRSPLYLACRNGHVDVVRYLLALNDHIGRPSSPDLTEPGRILDCNQRDGSGYTPLISACTWGHVDVVKILLEDERIDVNRLSNSHQSPLWWAASEGKLEVVKLLLASTRPVDSTRKDGFHKKTAAAMARHPEKMQWESEEEFVERKKSCPPVADLLEEYERQPEKVVARLRREATEPLAGELFALTVYLSDGYLCIPEAQLAPDSALKARRFFSLIVRLPLDLQMVLCNRVFGLGASILKGRDSEKGFKKFAQVSG